MKTSHRFLLPAMPLWSGLLLVVASVLARADDSSGFSTSVAAAGRQALPMHGYFMVILTLVFVVVFGITIYSMAKHRKDNDEKPGKFAGPTGSVQWLWAMVPFAILLFVDYILISSHYAG